MQYVTHVGKNYVWDCKNNCKYDNVIMLCKIKDLKPTHVIFII